MSRLGRRAGVARVALVTALATATLGVAASATASTSPPPTPTTTAHAHGDGQRLTPAEIAQQIAAADALTQGLAQSNAGISAATTKLNQLAQQANAILQRYAKARNAERLSREEAQRNIDLYHRMAAQLGADRKALGQWAYQAYASGGSLGEMSTLFDLLAQDAEAAGDSAAQLAYLSHQRSSAYERVRDHASIQREIAAKTVSASAKTTKAANDAVAAKKQLDVIVQQQQSQLDEARRLHAQHVVEAGPIAGLLLGSGDAKAVEASQRLRDALVVAGVTPDGSVTACSNDEQEYPNGAIPASGLCPLYGHPAESLRPSAAAAFNALSLAYEQETGQPICVTDSYRSYAEQVSVKASRGHWAATPGTSEHGFGRALDLCGGINSFGTPGHLWMKQNAPLYGWFHPDWAAPGGSLPEPWHWEYAG